MKFLGAHPLKVFHAVAACRAADNRILDNQDFLSFQKGFDRIEFHPHGKIAHRLGRLNKSAANIVIADHTHLKGNAAFFRVTDRGVISGIRKRHHQVNIRPVFPCQFMTQSFSAQINILAEYLAVGAGKVNQFKNAVAMFHDGKRFQTPVPLRINNNDFTGLYIPNVLGTYQIKRAGLGCHHPAAIEFA